jgi:hypothetical protein
MSTKQVVRACALALVLAVDAASSAEVRSLIPLVEGTDLSGSDYRRVDGVPDAAGCADHCAQDASCRAFTYHRKLRRCHLKSAVGKSLRHPDLISGIKSPGASPPSAGARRSPAPARPRIPLIPKTNLWGSDFSTLDRVPSAAACALACAEDTRCKAFTYGITRGKCWLKSEVPKDVRREDAFVSGIKDRDVAEMGAGVQLTAIPVLEKTNLRGGDYHSFIQPTPQGQGAIDAARRCAEACASDSRCRAFTYGLRERRCYLKAVVPRRSAENHYLSGIKDAAVSALRESAEQVKHAFLRGRWRQNVELRAAAHAFQWAAEPIQRVFDQESSGLEDARAAARKLVGSAVNLASVDSLARILYVLEREGTAEEAQAFREQVKKRVITLGRTRIETGAQVLAQAAFYHELFDVPCSGRTQRVRPRAWPPQYRCAAAVVPRSGEPIPSIHLGAPPALLSPPSDPDPKRAEPAKSNPALARERRARLRERDRFALPSEALATPLPAQFCLRGKGCHASYAEVATALYGPGQAGESLPVFCAPEGKRNGNTWTWDTQKVLCSSSWLDTLGGWNPWVNNEINFAAYPGADGLPPFACFGSPHLVDKHMVLPEKERAAKNGFLCRNRVFRVLATRAEKTQEDVLANIASLCTEMRHQVWGEKYSGRPGAPGAPRTVNEMYDAWCASLPESDARKRMCRRPPGAPAAGVKGAPPLPFLLLSREELLYFFGHQELYCRADRPGLTWFLDPVHVQGWAKSFTCGIGRAALEAGPFEEGVELCALAPYSGDRPDGSGMDADDRKARLHCWKFDRPTCEEVSNPKWAEEKDSIHRSNVFDAFDVLREARRTRSEAVWGLYDLRDAEKIQDYSETIAFQDAGKDEGTFGVRDFCRFGKDRKSLRCGYTKQTMAQWYELRKSERPEGCDSGVCVRGAYRRGYLCGLFGSKELFDGKSYWMCGIDTGIAGRKLLAGSRAICVGGAKVKKFQSSRGDTSSLQCYERRFRWGESEESEAILRGPSWTDALRGFAERYFPRERWLHGGDQLDRLLDQARLTGWWNGRKSHGMTGDFVGKVADHCKPGSWRRFETESCGWLPEMRSIDHLIAIRRGPVWWRAEGKRQKRVRGVVEAAYQQMAIQMTSLWKTKSSEELQRRIAGDHKHLLDWLEKHGHTLGHRTSMRLGLWASGIPVINEILAMRFKPTHPFSYHPLGGKKDDSPELSFHVERKEEMAIDAAKAKELNELLDDVRYGGRPVDAAWYQAFRLAATEGRQLRIPPEQLAVALRVHHLFEMLEAARVLVVSQAKAYHAAVMKRAARDRPRSRLGLHERARRSAIPERYKGSIFCVSDPVRTAPSGLPEYVCASSPLLVAGRVEVEMQEKKKLAQKASWFKDRSPEAKEEIEKRMQGKGRFGWCYGGMEGSPERGNNPSPALLPNRSSPYEMDIPPSVVVQGKNRINWLKCTGFAYSDEDWKEADPSREPGPETTQKAAAPIAARGKTSRMTSQIGGIIKGIIDLVLPGFVDFINSIPDLIHAATDFLDNFVGQFVKIAQAGWSKVGEALKKRKEEITHLARKRDKAREEMHQMEVQAAGGDKNAQEKLPALKERLKDLEKEEAAKEREQQKAIESSAATKAIPGTSNLINHLLDKLLDTAVARVNKHVSPRARWLFTKGLAFLHNILDPIANSVVTALASIPYVGSTLSGLALNVYQRIMAYLRDTIIDKLVGLVERLVGKAIRGHIKGLFTRVSKKVLELVVGFCPRILSKYGDFQSACPKEVQFAALPARDRWLERALACSPRELIDDRIRENAVAARHQLLGIAARMRREVPQIARDLADGYLARFGYNHDTWMAAVAGTPPARLAVRAAAIKRALRRAQ